MTAAIDIFLNWIVATDQPGVTPEVLDLFAGQVKMSSRGLASIKRQLHDAGLLPSPDQKKEPLITQAGSILSFAAASSHGVRLVRNSAIAAYAAAGFTRGDITSISTSNPYITELPTHENFSACSQCHAWRWLRLMDYLPPRYGRFMASNTITPLVRHVCTLDWTTHLDEPLFPSLDQHGWVGPGLSTRSITSIIAGLKNIDTAVDPAPAYVRPANFDEKATITEIDMLLSSLEEKLDAALGLNPAALKGGELG